ncbi:MAG: lysylphosphatidylglycerol synthase domain-containing protein, partial [Armatimonadota bacterium]
EGAASALPAHLPAHVDLLFSARALVVSAICLVGLVVAYAFRRPLYAVVARVNLKLANVIRDLASCFHEIAPGRQAGLLIYAAAAQVGELTMGYLIFRAVGVPTPLGVVFVGLALMVVVSNIPVALSGFGLRELTVVYLFEHYGTAAELLAVGVLISAVAYVLPMVIGLPLLGPLVRACMSSDPQGQEGDTVSAHAREGEPCSDEWDTS